MKRPNASAPIFLMLAATAPALLMPAKAHAAGYEFFQAPSGNIFCGVGTSDTIASAVCEIRDHTWVAPPRPTPCMGDWGDRVSLHQGSAPQMSCHTDTVQGSGYPTLEYGQTRSVNSITCQSELSGMTCTDSGTGHYFRLARDSYELH